MAISHHHVTATLSPDGRVSPLAFFTLFMPLIAADLLLYRAVAAMPAAERGLTNASALMLLVIYMQYCLLSRRRHDADQSGIPALGFLLVAVVCWYKTIDPAFLDFDQAPSDQIAFVLDNLHHLGRGLAGALFLSSLLKPSLPGPNRFGQEFGENSDRVSRWRTESVMGTMVPSPAARRTDEKTPKTVAVPAIVTRRRPVSLPAAETGASFGRLGRPAAGISPPGQ